MTSSSEIRQQRRQQARPTSSSGARPSTRAAAAVRASPRRWQQAAPRSHPTDEQRVVAQGHMEHAAGLGAGVKRIRRSASAPSSQQQWWCCGSTGPARASSMPRTPGSRDRPSRSPPTARLDHQPVEIDSSGRRGCMRQFVTVAAPADASPTSWMPFGDRLSHSQLHCAAERQAAQHGEADREPLGHARRRSAGTRRCGCSGRRSALPRCR